MLNLTTENVNKIIMDCLFLNGEDTSKAVFASGVMLKVGFNPERLAKHKTEIAEMLNQLPEEFQEKSEAKGMSFLAACKRKDGTQWGEHRSMDELFVLGMACGFVQCLLPREMWSALPGSMPYYTINTETSLSG